MLRVRRLSLRYPNGKLALADLDLSVRAGELVTVLGSNGSGKTTLLRCLVRTLKPTSGEVWVIVFTLSHHLRKQNLNMINANIAPINKPNTIANPNHNGSTYRTI